MYLPTYNWLLNSQYNFFPQFVRARILLAQVADPAEALNPPNFKTFILAQIFKNFRRKIG
jgi:hypothetical protein